MATLDQHQSAKRSKVMVVGEQGSGKSTLLKSLVEAGQELFILDFDDGLDNLRATLDPKYYNKVHYVTLKDDITWTGDNIPMIKGAPKAFPGAIKMIKRWKEGDEDYGPVSSWGPDRTLVIDSGTHMGQAAMNYTMYINKRNGKQKRQKDWGNAMDRQMGLLQQLTGVDFTCNVVVMFHLKRLRVGKFDEEPQDDKETKEKEEILSYLRYPSALGQSLPPEVGSWFNVVVQAKRKGHGPGAKYVLAVTPDPDVQVKVPASSAVKKALGREISNDEGLAKLFSVLQN